MLSYFKIEKYITYLIVNKKEFILKLYNYLILLKNTLDNKKLSIYSNLSKALLKYGNLKNDKYEKLFLLYVKYSYDYIKNIYNQDLSDEELLNILKDKDDIFIVKVNILEKNKNKDLLKYINNMKKLLNNYREYNDGIEILINKFESEFEESRRIKNIKKTIQIILLKIAKSL